MVHLPRKSAKGVAGDVDVVLGIDGDGVNDIRASGGNRRSKLECARRSVLQEVAVKDARVGFSVERSGGVHADIYVANRVGGHRGKHIRRRCPQLAGPAWALAADRELKRCAFFLSVALADDGQLIVAGWSLGLGDDAQRRWCVGGRLYYHHVGINGARDSAGQCLAASPSY